MLLPVPGIDKTLFSNVFFCIRNITDFLEIYNISLNVIFVINVFYVLGPKQWNEQVMLGCTHLAHF